MRRYHRHGFLLAGCMLLSACGSGDEPTTSTASAPAPTPATASAPAPGGEDKVLNIYNWSDYIAEDTIANFEKETGIKVRYDVFDSNEVLEAKLLAGNTGYDIVVPSAHFVARQIQAGLFQPLDKTKLPNYQNLDPDAMKVLAGYDPGNEHIIPWMWGTTGIGYNVAKIKERMPDAPVDSWKMLFDPTIVSKFKDCGVVLLDASSEVFPSALRYLGLPTDSQSADDLAKVEELVMKVRPSIKYFHSSQYVNDLANGEICLVLGWSGDVFIARDRAAEAQNGNEIAYSVPREGALMWFDTMAIPKDAPHADNAHKFIDYILRPEVVAAITNYVNYPNANAASLPFVKDEIKNDESVYPNPETRKNLFPNVVNTPEYDRLATRTWTRIKTNR